MTGKNKDGSFHEFAKASLREAIQCLGSQDKLGEAIGVSGVMVNRLLNHSETISSRYAALIERATHKKISRFDLSKEAQDLYEPEVDMETEEILPKIMDRVRKGMKLEEEMKNRKGRPKQEINEEEAQYLIKGKTDIWIAKKVGLGSEKNYRKGKYIYRQGIYALKKLVNQKHFSIDLAFKIAQLEVKVQHQFILLSKKAAIKKLKKLEREEMEHSVLSNTVMVCSEKHEINHSPMNKTLDSVISIYQDESLKQYEYKTKKSFRFALIAFMYIQGKNVSLPETNSFLKAHFYCSVEECIQILNQKNLNVSLIEGV